MQQTNRWCISAQLLMSWKDSVLNLKGARVRAVRTSRSGGLWHVGLAGVLRRLVVQYGDLNI